jgi:hypothetical protein
VKRIETRIQEFVEAREEVVILRRQKEQYPELLKKKGWVDGWNLAVSRSAELQRSLTGGQLQEAQRRLREKGLVDEKKTNGGIP